MSDKIPLHYTPKALTPEEREFATALGHEVSRALAVAVANPEMSFPAGSLAGRVQKTCQEDVDRSQGRGGASARRQAPKSGRCDETEVFRRRGETLAAMRRPSPPPGRIPQRGPEDQVGQGGQRPAVKRFEPDSIPKGSCPARKSRPDSSRGMSSRKGRTARDSTRRRNSSSVGRRPKWAPMLASGSSSRRARRNCSPRGKPAFARATARLGEYRRSRLHIHDIHLSKWLPPKPPPTGAEFYEVRVAA